MSFWNGVDLRYRLLKGPKIRISIAGIIISRVSTLFSHLDATNQHARDDMTFKPVHARELLSLVAFCDCVSIILPLLHIFHVNLWVALNVLHFSNHKDVNKARNMFSQHRKTLKIVRFWSE